jgi:alpha-glucosidase
MEIQALYTSGGDKVQMCYSFDFLSGTRLDPASVAKVLGAYEAQVGDGWACWAFSNHDVVRQASRWGLDDQSGRLFAALLLSLRGSICLYQGEELGLTEADVAFEDLQDPYGIRFWPKFKGRDGCRTPMPWERDNGNGGFSQGRPWLPMPAEHLSRAVAQQEGGADTMLAFYRRMIAYRQSRPALVKGTMTGLTAGDGVLSFQRHHAGQTLLCAFNMTADAQTLTLPDGGWRQDTGAPFGAATIQGRRLDLGPWQAFFAHHDTTR